PWGGPPGGPSPGGWASRGDTASAKAMAPIIRFKLGIAAPSRKEKGVEIEVPIRKGVRHLCRNGPQGAAHKGAWFEKGSGTFAGTARRVLRTKVPDPFSDQA